MKGEAHELLSQMHMHLGEHVRLTLFGSSHGPRVGAIINGLPQGIEIDENDVNEMKNLYCKKLEYDNMIEAVNNED